MKKDVELTINMAHTLCLAQLLYCTIHLNQSSYKFTPLYSWSTPGDSQPSVEVWLTFLVVYKSLSLTSWSAGRSVIPSYIGGVRHLENVLIQHLKSILLEGRS